MNRLIVFFIGSRVSAEINSSSILESKNSTALSIDSLAPLATNEAGVSDKLAEPFMASVPAAFGLHKW